MTANLPEAAFRLISSHEMEDAWRDLFLSCLAMVISYTTWHSVGWAIVHGLLSWLYVIYFVIRYC